MIVLDTNVISEPLRPEPERRVLQWLDDQAAETLYITAISYAELLVGIEMLPAGKRKDGLAKSLAALLERIFGSRILPFDRAAAGEYASIYAHTKKVRADFHGRRSDRGDCGGAGILRCNARCRSIPRCRPCRDQPLGSLIAFGSRRTPSRYTEPLAPLHSHPKGS